VKNALLVFVLTETEVCHLVGCEAA